MSTSELSTDTENPANGAFSLENILGASHETLEHPKFREEDKPAGGWDEESAELPAAEGFCVECEGSISFKPRS